VKGKYRKKKDFGHHWVWKKIGNNKWENGQRFVDERVKIGGKGT